jgi:hypothetical protein
MIMKQDPDMSADESNSQVNIYLGDCSDFIADQVKYGTLMFSQVLEDPEQGEVTEIVIMLFRQMLHIMDSVSILVKDSSLDSCRLLLRSYIEHAIQYSYLIRQETVTRSMWYQFFNYRRELAWMQRIDASTVEGRTFRKDLEKDPLFTGLRDSDYTSGAVAAYKRRLAQPDFRPIQLEYDRMTKANRKPKKWYSLYDGPQSLADLARATNMRVMYEMYYRRFSEHVHGNDILSGLAVDSQASTLTVPALRQLNVSGRNIVTLAISILWPLYLETIRTYKPSHLLELRRWYINEIQARHERIVATSFSA